MSPWYSYCLSLVDQTPPPYNIHTGWRLLGTSVQCEASSPLWWAHNPAAHVPHVTLREDSPCRKGGMLGTSSCMSSH